MSHGNGVCSAPINTDDVSAVTGTASHDVATLCTSDKIKKFNKNKPYRGTQPEVKSRTVDNAANETGKYLGSRGATSDFPVYWGMQYPMNTAGQNSSGRASSNLLELCYDCCLPAASKHPNFEYMKPVLGTDFCRLDDFVGYNHNAEAFLDAGVMGAEPGDYAAATIRINKYDNDKLRVYALIPSDSSGFEFKDLIPEADRYYLVAEFYITAMWVYKSIGVPFKVVKAPVSLGAAAAMIITLDIPISEILSAGNLGTTTDVSFYVCVGFNKYSGSTAAGSAAFIAPWPQQKRKCATLVTVMQGSPWHITIQQYALPVPTPTASSYMNFPTTETVLTSSTLFFKTQFYNGGQNPVTIYTEGGPANSLMFRAFTVGGNYDNPEYLIGGDSNQGHFADGGTATMGAHRKMKVGLNPDVSSTVNNVTIPAGQTETLYFKVESLVPRGNTSEIRFEVSNDGGASWAETGSVVARFKRN